jgi:energy-coupling factor transporter ATP-binding protein EcfA2/predicted metal-dependent hydrolase
MEVDFGSGQSIAVYGDNGTGKSTIADALEWFFTGGIELLSHEGRQHAIRNLGADGNGETSVQIVTSGDLGGRVVFPDERGPEAFGIASRETFLLRGRTLADFINKTKTEKWKALAELLGLDAIELLRHDLQRARNDIKKQVKAAEERIATSRRAISSGDAAVTEEEVLETLQQICRALGVDVPESLSRVADRSWMAGIAGESAALAPPKLEMLSSTASGLRVPIVDEGAILAWNAIVSSQGGKDLSLLTLFREAHALLSSSPPPESCPLCGHAVSGQELTSRVRDALTGLLESSREMEQVRDGVLACRDALDAALDGRRALVNQARPLRIKLADPPALPSAISAGLDRRATIDLAALTAFEKELERWDEGARRAIQKSAPAGSNTRQSQLAMLAVICEHIRAWRSAEMELARAQRALDLAERLYDAYQDRQKQLLEQMLTSISRRVAEIYGELHPGENLSGITVEPWTAKGVELAVDFHGSKQRPPHGVLSESHLNSLAIALFLAMAQTFNQRLRFLVLDDVINSFDLEHRGELAELLAEKFDDWQLVVLTHDRQFFDHLARRAPSWRRLELTSWSYEQGPRTTSYRSSGLLGEAQERLSQGDVSGAATKARRALEELLQEICEALAAALPFRRGTRNDQREIGELMKGVRRAVKEHARGMLEELEPLLKHVEADVQATLNVEAHASRGRSATAEVEASLRRLEQLDRIWSCPDCATRLWHKGTPESSRCKCGKSIFPPAPTS